MENIFKPKDADRRFLWGNLGDIKEGRAYLGEEMPVVVYRLMQFTIRDVLINKFGREMADEIFRGAGLTAGKEFAKNALNLQVDFENFVAGLQKALSDLKVGVLRIEQMSDNAGEITLTVSEDLDCSGLPILDEVVCIYDEGFIAGILEVYTGKPYDVREIDCWGTGDRTCRFKCSVCV